MRKLEDLPSYDVISRAIHTRGAEQLEALDELERRGLWLTGLQRGAAGLRPDYKEALPTRYQRGERRA